MDDAPKWFTGTVTDVAVETPQVKSFKLEMASDWPGHLAGQHFDLRLTAPDGYQAVRAYSFASAPNDRREVGLTVQMLKDGEVSGYLDTSVKVGDRLEISKPIGTHFIWEGNEPEPVTLIGGGSGVVPLASMLRHHQNLKSSSEMRLLYSVRTFDDIIYKDELCSFAGENRVVFTLTDEQPDGWIGYGRRIDRAMLTDFIGPSFKSRLFYICGPTPMVEAVANLLTELGGDPKQVKTERFGPSG